jgi:hypothetical protein
MKVLASTRFVEATLDLHGERPGAPTTVEDNVHSLIVDKARRCV